MKRLITFIIWAVVLSLILMSCGTGYHLRRAAFHKRMAIAKGADVTRDTTWKDITFKTKPIDVNWRPRIITQFDTMYYYKDSVITKILIRHDTVAYVETHCPEQEHTEAVPIATEETIKKPPWEIPGMAWVALAVIVILIVLWLRRR